ncbi:DUF4326 domain-containing protein [Rhodococcus sp. NPDC057014]|uniref:DUF4326 domain-containing protein n=1 Tax=Rhodococcus sp. NPDC057014 TaxID=3346000 RepID=UPI003627F572
MPEGAVYVGRPTKWGNPFAVHSIDTAEGGPFWVGDTIMAPTTGIETEGAARHVAVDLYALHTGPMGNYEFDGDALAEIRRDLGGRSLVCWCPLDQPCHADVSLEIANRAE